MTKVLNNGHLYVCNISQMYYPFSFDISIVQLKWPVVIFFKYPYGCWPKVLYFFV
jgi:hypothetical protein